MGRLNDADKFRRFAHEQLENEKVYSADDILECIDEQPTAYDAETVVNVVREAGAKLCCNKSCNHNCDCCVVDDALRDIIDAIRKGGVK